MKLLSLRSLILSILLLAVVYHATPSTVVSTGCTDTEVMAAINRAVAGDHVAIPPGSCTWTKDLTVSKRVYLEGAGSNLTHITIGPTMTLALGKTNSNISGFHFISAKMATGESYISIHGANGGWRIHHNIFDNSAGSINNIALYINTGTDTNFVDPVGVIDHNIFKNSRVYSQGDASPAFGGAQWSSPTNWGSGQNVYVEDNQFIYSLPQGNCMDSQYGGRYVARFNTVTGCPFETHDTTNGRATRSAEIYYNNWISTGKNAVMALFTRGGSQVQFGNSFSTGYATVLRYSESRDHATGSGANAIYQPLCYLGTNALDQNSGSPGGYHCRDQQGTGPDVTPFQYLTRGFTISDTTNSVTMPFTLPTPVVVVVRITSGANITGGKVCFETFNGLSWVPQSLSNQTSYTLVSGAGQKIFSGNVSTKFRARLCEVIKTTSSTGSTMVIQYTAPAQTYNEPWPVFLNRKGGVPATVTLVNSDDPNYIQNGREYQLENPSFNGTIGTGVGPGANKPTTCKTGVYYWATDEGNWNAGTNPFYTGQGRLYKCTAANVWTPYYTPYMYPHPLTAM